MSNVSLKLRALSQYAAMLMGALMLAVALPYAIAMSQLEVGERGIAPAIMRHETALSIFPDSATLADLALLRVAAARTGTGTWEQAQASLEAALAQRPQDALNWARLAYVYGEQKNYSAIGPALARSISTGSYIPGFMQWRFLLGLTYWPHLNAAQKQLMAAQALMLWQTKPNDFIRLARMPAIALQIESIMQEYYPIEAPAFLQRRRSLRHTR